MKITRHVQTIQNRKLVIFLQYIKKKIVETAFVFYCDAKHSDILRGSRHVVICWQLFSGSIRRSDCIVLQCNSLLGVEKLCKMLAINSRPDGC